MERTFIDKVLQDKIIQLFNTVIFLESMLK